MRKFFLVPIALALTAYVLLPLPGGAAPIEKRIQVKRAQVDRAKRKEGVLTTTISRFNDRIRGLQGQIDQTQKRLGLVQGQLGDARSELLRVRDRLQVARDRLERARAELRRGRAALADRLVEIYKSDEPDALTVVLESNGFADLLDRTDFLQRISDQDRKVVTRVKVLRVRAQTSEKLYARLEQRKQQVAVAILRRRDDIASTRDQLASSQGDLRTQRNGRRTVLASVQRGRRGAQEDLASLEREQAKIRAQLANAAPGAFAPSAGPVRKGSGRFIWPVNGPITSPFGPRWGRLHAGIDIAAPGGTPIRAADNGRVTLAAPTGGYGNYTCIQHTATLSTCYAHQSRLGTSVGAAVRQGQVMGYVGNTGNSFGNHLHFEVRVNGTPVNPLGYL